jgi:hypothetical protein
VVSTITGGATIKHKEPVAKRQVLYALWRFISEMIFGFNYSIFPNLQNKL